MVCMQLSQERYESFKRQLIEKAQQEPFDASFTVPIEVNGTEYLLKVQPSRKCKMYALQALKIERDKHGKLFELITNNVFLVSLMDILVRQWVG